MLKTQGIDVTVVILYVDDLLMIANVGLFGPIENQIKNMFRLHDVRIISFYLSMIIEHNLANHMIDNHHHSYIHLILAKFRMDECIPDMAPMAMKLYKRKPNPEACDPNGYQAMIGCHTYKMSPTESDITYTIGVPSRYTHDPSNEQMVALARMFQYPESTKCWMLHFGGALGAALRGEGAGTHACYIHSYYTGCHDGNCSTSGQVITCTGAVNWTSRKRQLTAQSMTDAEHSDISVGRMRLTKISHLLNVLSIPTFHHVFSYSQSLIVSIKRRIYHRTAAAQNAIKYYLTTDIARYGEIVLGYTPTAVMLANCSTQPLPNPRFLNQCAGMGMISV